MKELSRGRLIFLALIVCAIGAFTPLRILSFIVLLYIGGSVLPLPSLGIISKIAVSFIGIMACNTILAAIAWVFHEPLNASFMLLVYSVGLIVFFKFKSPREIFYPPIWKKSELFAFIISLVIMLITLLPVFKNSGITNVSRVLSFSGDNISHLELVSAVTQKQGYTYKKFSPSTSQFSVIKPLIGYPQGYHVNDYLLNDLIKPLHGKMLGARRLLLTFQLYSSIWFALLIYMFIVVCLRLTKNVRTLPIISWAVTATAAGWLFLGSFFTLFALGAHTQIAALTMLLAILLIANEVQNTSAQSSRLAKIAIAVLASSIAFIWLFLWPIVLIIEFALLSKQLWQKFYNNKLTILVLLAISSTALVQVYVQLVYSVKTGSLNENGFIVEINNFLVVALLALAALYFIAHQKSKIIAGVIYSVAAAALFAAGILVYQLATVGEPRYYYFKSIYTLLLLVALPVVAVIGEGLSSVFAPIFKIKRLRLLALSVLFIAGLSMVLSQRSTEAQAYLSQMPYGISIEEADAVATLSNSRHNDLNRTLAIGSCNRAQDIKTINLAMAIGGIDSISSSVASTQFSSADKYDTFDSIYKYEKKVAGKIVIISSDYQLQQQLLGYTGIQSSRLEFTRLGDAVTGVEKPSSLCPDRLH